MFHRGCAYLALSWLVLSPASAEADLPAVGWVDVANQTWLMGWTHDGDCPACPVWVHVYVDGVYRGAALGDQFRPDVGAHAFNFRVPPLTSGAHSAIAYAIGINAGGVPTGSNPPLNPPRTLISPERRADFNGDGITEPAIYRRTGGTWWAHGLFGAVQWGFPEDVPVAADYDGDGRSDRAVYRPSNGHWYIVRSSDGAPDIRGYGGGSPRVAGGGHVPVPGDYNGDGRAEPAVFRTTDSTWHAWGVHAGVQWGLWGDIPVPGDYDGDGRLDIAVFRPSNGHWYAIRSSTGAGAVISVWGGAGDIPVQADYDGDGRTEVAIFRPTTGEWWVHNLATNAAGVRGVFGGGGDVPTPADFNGDRLTDIAVFRPSNSMWYVSGIGAWQWGLPGDIPAAHALQFLLLAPPTCGDGLPAGAACPGGACNAAGVCSTAFLRAGESLLPGQCRSSASGRYRFCYQADGVLAVSDGGNPVWWRSDTAGSPGRVTLQGNGNLVLFNAGGSAVLQSGDLSADLTGPPALQVLDNGDVVIDQQDNLEGLLSPPTPPSGPASGTCDIEIFTRNAFQVPTTVHDVVKITYRDAPLRPATLLLNMQGGQVLGCNEVTCNKQHAFDGCGSTDDPFHHTRRTWNRMGLPHLLCDVCAAGYLDTIGYDYALADSNAAVGDCFDKIQEIQPGFKRPSLFTFPITWDPRTWLPSIRSGREYKFPWQGGKTPRQRCADAIQRHGCAGLASSGCPMICGNVETHLCEQCEQLPECVAACPQNPTACGCPDEPGHGGSCGSTDACGHAFGTPADCGCPGEPNHQGSCGSTDACGHTFGTRTQCGCPDEPNHQGSCGSIDACGHVFGSPSDPGCCVPSSSCASQDAQCGSIWDGCDWVDCGECQDGFDCTPEQRCACTETTSQTCGWVTLCGRRQFLGDCDPGDCIDDRTGERQDICCADSCGQHPNDVCEPDGTCTCIGTCSYPSDCGLSDGCGNTCNDLCGPCGDGDNDCYDDCTWDYVCDDDDDDPPDDCFHIPGCWKCGGPGGCEYSRGGGDECMYEL